MADKKFIDEVIKAHNQYRANHQAPPLTHNKELSAHAQKWADRLAETDTFEHSDPDYNGKNVGENIAMKWSSKPKEYSGQEITDEWYNEIRKYKYAGHQPGCGHFTQVVWKESKEIGIGKAQTQTGKTLVVANYLPAGNMIGDFPNNVSPPKGGSIAPMKKSDKHSTTGSTSKQIDKVSASHDINKGSGFGNFIPGMNQSSGESRSVSTRTVTKGSGPNKIVKTITEERITKADGQVIVSTKETITSGGRTVKS